MGNEAHRAGLLGEHARSEHTGLVRPTRSETKTPVRSDAAPGELMRLFVAIAPPPDTFDELDALAGPLRAGRPDLRWTGRDAWHVTLAFLGQVDEAAATRLRPRLERAVRRPRGAGAPGRLGGRGREPGRRSAARQGPPVPAPPDSRALPDAGRRHRARRRAGRLPGAAVDRGSHPPGSQPPRRHRTAPLHHARELAAAPPGAQAP